MDGKKLKTEPIIFNIYAEDKEEAERGRQAIIQFINAVGRYGARVSGDKLAEAVKRLDKVPYIKNEIIKFFRD